MLISQCHFDGPAEANGLPEAHGPRGHCTPPLSGSGPKYLTLLFTAIGRPSHKIFGFCVAVLCTRFCSVNCELISFHSKTSYLLCLIEFSNGGLKRYKNQVNDLNDFGCRYNVSGVVLKFYMVIFKRYCF